MVSRCHHPPEGEAAAAASFSDFECLPLHHWSAGTIALTEAMWEPQPAQVVFVQVLQTTGLHMCGS